MTVITHADMGRLITEAELAIVNSRLANAVAAGQISTYDNGDPAVAYSVDWHVAIIIWPTVEAANAYFTSWDGVLDPPAVSYTVQEI